MPTWKSKSMPILVVVQILLISTTAFAQEQAIRVVYYPPWNVSKLPLYLARDAAVFEKNGLQLSWKNPGSNDNLLTAMKKNEGDIYVVSSNHVMQSNAATGSDLVIVANTGHNYSVFLVDSSVAKPEDLKGKKIGTGELGSTPYQLTRLSLRRLGLDPDKDVTLVSYASGRSSTRALGLLSGEVSGSLVSSDAIFELEKTGDIKRFRILADHKKLNIYAGGGADYAISAAFLKSRRDKAKIFLGSICEAISLARKNKPKALEVIAKTVRKSDPAVLEFLYRIYVGEVIPVRPYPRTEGVELGIQMISSTLATAKGIKAQDLVDRTLVEELEREGRCNS
jgi:ABC-type nitrate/sulfonate/bicarbonate transport system substrate-binding protein